MIVFIPTNDNDYCRDDGHDPTIKPNEDPKFQFAIDYSDNGCKSSHSLALTCNHNHDHDHSDGGRDHDQEGTSGVYGYAI